MANCHNCERLVICPWATPDEIICSSFKPKPQTNADRIRAMSDNKFAEIFKDLCCPFCFDCDYVGKCGQNGGCKDCWLAWLKQEVTE